MTALSTLLVRYLELVLGAGGAVSIALVSWASIRYGLFPRLSPWHAAAFAACSAMLLNSAVCWWVRRRQRVTRLALVNQIKAMLTHCGVQEIRHHPELERLLGKRIVVALTLAEEQLSALAGEPLHSLRWQSGKRRATRKSGPSQTL